MCTISGREGGKVTRRSSAGSISGRGRLAHVPCTIPCWASIPPTDKELVEGWAERDINSLRCPATNIKQCKSI